MSVAMDPDMHIYGFLVSFGYCFGQALPMVLFYFLAY